MSKPFNYPFYDNDMMKMFDMSKYTDGVHMPQFDAEAAFSLQRKNIEAFTALNQAAYENFQSLWQRQADSFRQVVEQMTQTAQSIMSAPTPEGKAMKQAEISKAAMEKYIANLRDASDTIAKYNNQALETVSTRLNEGLNELRNVVKCCDKAA